MQVDDLSLTVLSSDESVEGLKRRIKSYLKTAVTLVPLPSREGLLQHPLPSEGEGRGEGEEYDLSELLAEWLAFSGPVEKDTLQHILGLTAERLDESIEPLIEARDLVMDSFGEQSTGLEICDSGNLEMLLRMSRRYRQPSFQALPIDRLPLFLAAYQGLVPQGESMDELQQKLEQLFGWPAPATAWEEYILPARMRNYRNEWLDSLMSTTDLIWFGCGKQRISLAFKQDLDLFRQDQGTGHAKTGKGDSNELEHLIPDRRGRFSFLEIAEFSHLDTVHATELLWKEAWKGNITSDSFRTVRRGAMADFTAQAFSDEERLASRRSGFNRWKLSRPLEGHWLRIDPMPGERDILDEQELIKDRIRQLLKRYGILFRELLSNELPVLQWRAIFRSLRLMELSGEIVSGYFFEGISGLQFMSHEAFRIVQKPLPHDAVFWLNAADPASLCGLLQGAVQGLPSRIASTHLVYHGSRLVMISKRNGKSLDILAGREDTHLPEYFSLFKHMLAREFNPIQKISVATINNEPVLRSPYAEALKQFGFHSTRNAVELWKEF
jgi:ATP-dependent Lhr-like helicase